MQLEKLRRALRGGELVALDLCNVSDPHLETPCSSSHGSLSDHEASEDAIIELGT